MRNKFLFYIILTALIGGAIGSLLTAFIAQANFFNDFYNNYLKSPFQKIYQFNQQGNFLKKETTSTQSYAPTANYEQMIIDAIEKASPAVVSVVISKNLPVIEQCSYNPFGNLPPEFQQFFGGDQNFKFYQPCQKGTKEQEVGGGSGFIISNDGMIATNKHVVADESAEYTVLTNSGKKYKAKVLARDPVRDLAIIKISANNLPTVTLGDSNSLRLGQTVIAIGNALGEFRNTVSHGIVSGISRSITASGGGGLVEKISGLIQTDAAINPGNSGGPLLNLKGEVIGINVAMVSGAQNIGFAIPINQVKHSINSAESTGKISAPYIGVRYLIINSDLAQKENLPVENGALVRGNESGPAIVKNSPADKAGLQAEDIITEVNGEKIIQNSELSDLIQKYNIGDQITLKFFRNGKSMEIKVILAERPKNL